MQHVDNYEQTMKEKIEILSISDKGLVRKKNEDAISYSYNLNGDLIAIICDGIGGLSAGDFASLYISRELSLNFANTSFHNEEDLYNFFDENIKRINSYIYNLSLTNEKFHGIGSTLCAIIVFKNYLYAFNIGDSRLYELKNDLIQISEDHSFVNTLIKKQLITKEEALNHPKRNLITNAVGINKNIKYDRYKILFNAKYYLLSTDGLHSYLSHEMIKKIISSEKKEQDKLNELLKLVYQNGAIDNITVVLIINKGDYNE